MKVLISVLYRNHSVHPSVHMFCKCNSSLTDEPILLKHSLNQTSEVYFMFTSLVCYSAPQDGEQHQQNSKNLAVLQARKNAIDIVSAICRVASDLLHRSQTVRGEVVKDTLGSAQLFKSLLPLCLAYIGPVASQDPRVGFYSTSLWKDTQESFSEVLLIRLPWRQTHNALVS